MKDVGIPETPDGDAAGEIEEPLRVNKRDFIRKMAKQGDLPINVSGVAYEAFVATLLAEIMAGARVNLTGFGRFYFQLHKGHKVRFADPDDAHMPDYSVLKFSATREANEFIGRDVDDVVGTRIPGTRMIYDRDDGELTDE